MSSPYRDLDPQQMYETIAAFPEQWERGRQRALETNLGGLSLEGSNHVVILGMGGSAIGGDLLRTLALQTGVVPVSVFRGYTLPAWVGSKTLVVASSYSGNTEETLSALDEAQQRDARIACITSGGELSRRAAENDWPVIELEGGLQPRAALGYSLTAVLTLAEKIGLLTFGAAAWDETQRLLEDQAARYAGDGDHLARSLARSIQGTLPVVYAGVGLLEAVAMRWQTQLHENSKTLAYGNLFPELNHNEIMGWERPDDLHRALTILVLRDRADHPQVQRRMEVTASLVADRANAWHLIDSEGESPLARVLSLINLGDWVSFYLAMSYEVDPTPVHLISRLKETLAR